MIKRFKESEVLDLANILKNDGVISVPTDTVYGLCARIDSKEAHDKLMNIKNRPFEKSFPVMCASEEQIRNIAIVNENAKKIINNFMPGPITLVLKRKEEIPDYVTNGKDTIALRIATTNALESLIEKLESPIFLTSANLSGEETCTNLDEIEKNCPFIDGIMEGNVKFSKSSTIVDCTEEQIKIIRQGPISEEQIYDVIKK